MTLPLVCTDYLGKIISFSLSPSKSVKVVLLSLALWEGTPRTQASECKYLELWKFADLSLWGLPVLCYSAVGFHSFLQCSVNPSVFLTSRSV